MKQKKLLETTSDRRVYLSIIKYVDPWDESERFIKKRINKGCVGYWKRKRIYPSQVRSYRTWKYNRKTQWKEKE